MHILKGLFERTNQFDFELMKVNYKHREKQLSCKRIRSLSPT